MPPSGKFCLPLSSFNSEMATDILSQDEVDALLKGVVGDSDETTADKVEEGVRTYSLEPQERITRGRMPALELINERFARHLRVGLFDFMHRNTEISVGPIRLQKYIEFIRNLIIPTSLNLVAAKPLRGTALFAFDPDLVFLVVDSMFGSDGRFQTRVDGRDFTTTEQRIIRGLLQVVFAEYARSWQPVYDLSFDYIRSEMNSQFANIATPSEIVISTTFSIEFGGMAANMHICFPISMIEPIRDLLFSAMQSNQVTTDQRWISMMRKQLGDTEVEIIADLATATLTLGEVVRLKPGDIIPIEAPETITVNVDEVPLLECTYGQQAGHYALKIDRLITPNSDEPNLPRE